MGRKAAAPGGDAMTAGRILLMQQPDTRAVVALYVPAELHLFRLFTRNGWRPHGEAARAIALELCTQEEERRGHE